MTEQPAPVANNHPPIVPQVIADLDARMQLGIQRYGVALQPGNGRNMLVDAYEEAQDLTIYLRGAIADELLRMQHLGDIIDAAQAVVLAYSGEPINRLVEAVSAYLDFTAPKKVDE